MSLNNNLHNFPIWHSKKEDLFPPPNAKMTHWLTTQILSAALREKVPSVYLELVRQGIDQPHSDEAAKLQFDEKKEDLPLVRQVTIGSANCRYLYCRVVVPSTLYYQEQSTFDTLGSRFIGETMLYHQPEVHRSTFEYAILSPHHTLYQEALRYTHRENALVQPILYSRRSLFYLPILPLLITEVFVHVVSLS